MRYLILFWASGLMISCSENNSKRVDDSGYDENSNEVRESNRYNNIHNLDQRAAVYRNNVRK